MNRRTFVGASIAVGGVVASGPILAGCGEDEEGDTVMLEPGEDDKEFLLSEKSACPAYEEW